MRKAPDHKSQFRLNPPIRVALVDDDSSVLRSWQQLLDSPAFTCIAAFQKPECALREIPVLMPHVVLMDVRMPKLSGITCTQLLCSRMRNLRVIMVSAATEIRVVRSALAAGACGYLVKGESETGLADAIFTALRNITVLSDSVRRALLSTEVQAATFGETLTHRQQEILRFLTLGHTDKLLADDTGLSITTVRFHLRALCRRLGVHSRAEAVAKLLAPEQ